MSANIWFWLLYVITLVFGVWGMNPWRPPDYQWAPFGGWLILFILIGILGLHEFGSPIR
jgi:Mg2+ and Co2+ transporter CorA